MSLAGTCLQEGEVPFSLSPSPSDFFAVRSDWCLRSGARSSPNTSCPRKWRPSSTKASQGYVCPFDVWSLASLDVHPMTSRIAAATVHAEPLCAVAHRARPAHMYVQCGACRRDVATSSLPLAHVHHTRLNGAVTFLRAKDICRVSQACFTFWSLVDHNEDRLWEVHALPLPPHRSLITLRHDHHRTHDVPFRLCSRGVGSTPATNSWTLTAVPGTVS
jgi:hypothetical protein